MLHTIHILLIIAYSIGTVFFAICWYLLFKAIERRKNEKWDILDWGVYTVFVFHLVEYTTKTVLNLIIEII